MIFTIAIEPDIKLIERLTFLQEDLGKILATRGADSRWTRPEFLHVPIVYLGMHDEAEIPEFNQIMRDCVKGISPFYVTVAGISAYPSPQCPRLIEVSATAGGTLLKLREKLMHAFRAANYGFDKREFKTSMLLGRVATHESRVDMTDAIDAIHDLNFGQSEIFEIVLYGADLGPTGPIHKVISRFSFQETTV